jgi:hypothetical protein
MNTIKRRLFEGRGNSQAAGSGSGSGGDGGSGGAGGTPLPGSGGNSVDTVLTSGFIGEWLSLNNRTANFFDEQLELKYKADLQAFPKRSIVFLEGQFGINSTFDGSSITLGNIPLYTRPKAQLKKYMFVKNVELFLVIETNGDVKLVCKDTDNYTIPVTDAGAETETQPYYIECYFNPDIPVIDPVVYTAHRAADFTRNNCGAGKVGSAVHFAKDYTSLADQGTADANADANFNTDGQLFANNPANGATCTVIVPPTVYTANRSADFTRQCDSGKVGSVVHFTKAYTSTVSQAAANAAAAADANFNTDGQAFANDPANGGTCTVVTTYVANRSGSFTRGNCDEGYAGTSIPFSKTYTSTVSQAAADGIALANFDADGQAFADDDANGATCEIAPSDVALTMAAEGGGGGFFVTGDLAEAVGADIQIYFFLTYTFDGFDNYFGPVHSLIIPWGETHGESFKDWFIANEPDRITNVIVTVTRISPNPVGLKTITY